MEPETIARDNDDRYYVRQLATVMCARVAVVLIFWSLMAQPPLSAQQPKLRATIGAGHSASVYCVAFSPDFKTFASASGDTTVKLWETATGKELATLTGHRFPVAVVAFSPDGRFLYSHSDHSDARVWDAATRKAIAADDVTLAAATGWQRPARITDGHAPAKIATLIKGKFDLVRPSPDGKTIATVDSYILSSRPQALKIWHASTGQHLLTLHAHAGYFHSLEFSPDGKILAASNDCMLKLWDVTTGKNIDTILLARMWSIYALAFSRDGRTLISAARSELQHWNPATGKNIEWIVTDWWYAHPSSSTLRADQKTLALGGSELSLWDATTRKTTTLVKFGFSYSTYAVTLSNDANTLAVGGDKEGGLSLWDLPQRKKTKTLGPSGVHALAFSPDDKVLASGHGNGSIKLWDVATGDNMATFMVHSGPVSSIAFNHDGKLLASASSDKMVQVWDLEAGKNTRTLKIDDRINSLAFRPKSNLLASAGYERTVRLWDAGTGRTTATLVGHTGAINAVAFSPDGNLLASAADDGTIRLWEFP